MSKQQKKAAAGVGLAYIILAAIFVIWLALSIALSDDYLGDRLPGRFFMLLIHNEDVVGTALKALPFIIAMGLSYFVPETVGDKFFYSKIAMLVVAIVASVYCLIDVSDVETARRFWQVSPVLALDDYGSFKTAAQSSLGAFVGWLVILLAGQLGIKLTKSEGEDEGEND